MSNFSYLSSFEVSKSPSTQLFLSPQLVKHEYKTILAAVGVGSGALLAHAIFPPLLLVTGGMAAAGAAGRYAWNKKKEEDRTDVIRELKGDL